MTVDFAAEGRRAFGRAVLVVALVGAWCGYALRAPSASGIAALKTAIAKKAPAKPGSASVSWAGGGVPLAPQELIRRAQEISEKANAKARDLGIEAEDRRPGDEDPAVVVPMMIGYLTSPSTKQRAYAAMTMCDNRFAKWERAGEAVPGLEEVAASRDPEGAEFARLALKRIRFWAGKRGR